MLNSKVSDALAQAQQGKDEADSFQEEDRQWKETNDSLTEEN